jgi:hypothetical protein
MKSDSTTDLPHNNGESLSAQPSRIPLSPKLRPVYRMAEQHCANWCRGGTCVGVGFDIYTQRYYRITNEGDRCLLALDQRCPYFEKSVLPMEKRGERDWPTFIGGQAFREAARLYHSVFPETVAVPPTTRKCPDCGKHRIGPRKRCCAECRNRRRKATDAENHRIWRKETAQRHTVNENGSSLVADSRGTNSKPATVYQPTPFLGAKLYYEGAQSKGGAS